MNAYVLHGVNNLKLENIPVPELMDDEALIEVKAVGICGSDIPRIFETGTHKHPLVPGHEFSGIVVSVANKENSSWIGKRVGVFPLIPCYQCSQCKNHYYEMCRNYSYLGSRQDGAFAEYVKVPVKNLIELPPNVSFEVAAMLEPMAVAVHAIRRISISNSNTIAIQGLGTIGMLIAVFLKNLNVDNVIFVGKKNIQRQIVKKLGFPDKNFFDIRSQNVVEEINTATKNQGVDVFFECVGKNDTVNNSILVTRPFGNVVLVGNPASDISFDKNVYWKILRNQLTVKGTWNSSFLHCESDDWNYVLKILEQNLVEPSVIITHKFSLNELKIGLDIMKNKTEEYCKIMLVN